MVKFGFDTVTESLDVVDALVEIASTAGRHEIADGIDALIFKHLSHLFGFVSRTIAAVCNRDDVVNLHFLHLNLSTAVGTMSVILVVHLLPHGFRDGFSLSVLHSSFNFLR